MKNDVTRLDISMRRRSLIGYCAGMALYTLVIVALYPSFKGSTSLDNLVKSDATAVALFGISGSISSSGGWLNANIYANFFPLIMLLLTVGYGAAALAGQDEDGTLGLMVALPIARPSILLQKVAAMVTQGLILAIVVAVCVVIGRAFQLTTTVGDIAGISLAVLLMSLDFGIVTMAIGAWTGRKGTAVGVGAALAASSYLISSLAPVVSGIRPLRYLSLFYWSVGNNQISSGVELWSYVVLIAVGACALCAASFAFRAADLH